MQPVSAPATARQQRHSHVRPVHRALAVELGDQRRRPHQLAHFTAVRRELFVGERRWSADKLPVVGIAKPSLTTTVLDVLQLPVDPVTEERPRDAAMMGGLAVEVSSPFPWADRRQMRRLAARRIPLSDGVVRDAGHPDATAAPRLLGRPLDALVNVLVLARTEGVQVPLRSPRSAGISTYEHVAVG